MSDHDSVKVGCRAKVSVVKAKQRVPVDMICEFLKDRMLFFKD